MNAPQVPSATSTAAAQTKSNIDTATAQTRLNAIDQITPTGSLKYTQIGKNPDGTPKLQATTALTPAQQAIFDKQTQTGQNLANVASDQSARLGTLLNGGIDLNALPQAGNANAVTGGPITSTIANAGAIQKNLGPNDFSSDRTAIESALRQRIDPQLDRQEVSLRTRLAGQGIKEGSEAWNNAVDALRRQRNDADLAITAQGLQEQQGQQGLALNKGGFANAAQQQQYTQNASDAGFANTAQAQRYGQANTNFANQNTANQLALSNLVTSQNQPLNQLLAVAGQGGVQSPNFVNTPNSGIQGTDVASLINGQYQNQLAQTNGFNNALGSIGSTVGGWLFSDEKLKTDIHATGGKTPDGIPLKTFRYRGSPMLQMGVTAQDTMRRRPDAVRQTPMGKQVNYSKIRSPMLRLGA